MERGKRSNLNPVDDYAGIKLSGEELSKAWAKAGYTLDEIIKLTEDSYINTYDMGGITAEEASNTLEEAINKVVSMSKDIIQDKEEMKLVYQEMSDRVRSIN